ncbi:MAG TPA: hypothetical protein VNQ78_18745 [Paracoccus sp. (in: a-proteobacteria)]|uniref:hypothetical protein n=1 Tax=Paracoccus sp. TaxID=267 RepID=UPI002C0970EC|nr:hypothetical protein [Paracoccus sp. (in: a-proteobacteria)]HWL58696.1 hypothetical protein [Paracoccus sp. (in: a-proteobacteria)]
MISVKRLGDDPAIALPAMIRTGVWDEVMHRQTLLTRAAQARGDLPDTGLERRLRVNGRSRTVDSWQAVSPPPWPPYATTTAGSNAAPFMAEAANFVLTRYQREAPASSNQPKDHNYRLRSSATIFINQRRIAGQVTDKQISPDDAVHIVVIAPHASTVEAADHLLARITKIAQGMWPDLGISFGWTGSETYGIRFGRGSGGPTRGAPYSLPTVTIRAGGRSVIGTARKKRNRKGKR